MRGRELDKGLTPNIALRKSIEEWRQAQGLAGGGTYSAKASRVDEEEKEEKEEVPVGTIVSPGSNVGPVHPRSIELVDEKCRCFFPPHMPDTICCLPG
jgi:hypothetical protein